LLVLIAGANDLLTLVIAAAMTILLGMGMPTPAAYALAAALIAPTLVGTYGYSVLQSHMFLLYFAVLSAMTPPVAVAAYAASAIADANPVGIAVQACKLAVAAFVLPFAFMYAPGVLMEGSLPTILYDCLRALVMVVALAVAAEGYWRRHIGRLYRLSLASGALLMLSPQPLLMALGAALVAVGAAGAVGLAPLPSSLRKGL